MLPKKPLVAAIRNWNYTCKLSTNAPLAVNGFNGAVGDTPLVRVSDSVFL